MNRTSNLKVTISLPVEALTYADRYKEAHGLNRSEVLTLALQVLRERELAEGYHALAAEQQTNPDPLLDSGLDEVVTQTKW